MAGSTLRHPVTGRSVLTVTGVALLVATFLPWLGEGGGARNSYELLGVLGRLEIAPNGFIALLVRCWPLVPLLVTTAVVLGWWGRSVASLAMALVAAGYVGGVAGSLGWFSRGTRISVEVGVWASAVLSVALVAATIFATITSATALDARAPHGAPPADPS